MSLEHQRSEDKAYATHLWGLVRGVDAGFGIENDSTSQYADHAVLQIALVLPMVSPKVIVKQQQRLLHSFLGTFKTNICMGKIKCACLEANAL